MYTTYLQSICIWSTNCRCIVTSRTRRIKWEQWATCLNVDSSEVKSGRVLPEPESAHSDGTVHAGQELALELLGALSVGRRRAQEEHGGGVWEQWPGARADHAREYERDERVGPEPAEVRDQEAAHDDPHRAQRVRQHVQEHACENMSRHTVDIIASNSHCIQAQAIVAQRV